ncbi:unnamed protein product, partial [Adineta ricciae]
MAYNQQNSYPEGDDDDGADNERGDQLEHIMLSYQWDSQKLVEKVYNYLTQHSIPVWMDKNGGMQDNVFL